MNNCIECDLSHSALNLSLCVSLCVKCILFLNSIRNRGDKRQKWNKKQQIPCSVNWTVFHLCVSSLMWVCFFEKTNLQILDFHSSIWVNRVYIIELTEFWDDRIRNGVDCAEEQSKQRSHPNQLRLSRFCLFILLMHETWKLDDRHTGEKKWKYSFGKFENSVGKSDIVICVNSIVNSRIQLLKSSGSVRLWDCSSILSYQYFLSFRSVWMWCADLAARKYGRISLKWRI